MTYSVPRLSSSLLRDSPLESDSLYDSLWDRVYDSLDRSLRVSLRESLSMLLLESLDGSLNALCARGTLSVCRPRTNRA